MAEATSQSAAPTAAKKKKSKRSVPAGQVHILATFNNTIVTFTDAKGGVLTASSAGACGFRGSKKGTAYAAQVAAEKAGNAAKQQHGLSKVEVFVRGVGLGRDAAIRTLQNLNMQVESITDVTGVPHGGVRARKARRI
ncbi:MAG TPA: 30S ribosomal protein S11 [Candidatus Saccharimonadales bacterium]|nr:30S ribosomal protein S11 [Candidatus Saccharimonadales bacterium]